MVPEWQGVRARGKAKWQAQAEAAYGRFTSRGGGATGDGLWVKVPEAEDSEPGT